MERPWETEEASPEAVLACGLRSTDDCCCGQFAAAFAADASASASAVAAAAAAVVFMVLLYLFATIDMVH